MRPPYGAGAGLTIRRRRRGGRAPRHRKSRCRAGRRRRTVVAWFSGPWRRRRDVPAWRRADL